MATNVIQAFNEFRSRLELSETLQEAISTHHNSVRGWIENYNSTIETKLIGSLQRKTRIQRWEGGKFDIDILVILGSFNIWVMSGGVTPAAALGKVEDIVSENEVYDRMGPETDSPTIIIDYADDIKVELVPAYIDNIGRAPDGTPTLPVGRGYWIPKNNRWIMADYDYDADFISKKNKECDGWLIPTIKMMKAMKRNLFSKMKSFHLEILAVNIIPELVNILKKHNITPSYPFLVRNFFAVANGSVDDVCCLPGSKSPSASDYLNEELKASLQHAFKVIDAYTEELLKKEGRDAVMGWREIFREPFPSYG